MTNKFLLNLLGFNPDLTSRQPRVDTLSLVSRQSDLLTHLGRITAILILVLTIGVGNAWGAEGDTHDFSQTLSQVLNSGVSIADVTVAEQTYTVKEVKVTVNYNKSRPGATVSVKVGGVTFGSAQTINSSTTTTFTFTGASAVKGQVVVSSTNNCTSSSGNGTFKITNVRLVEGASAGCSNSVALSKGTATNGTVNTISSASVATCSSTASDRRVTVTITPDECYDAPTNLTWTKSSGTVSASKQSGPTDNGDGTYSYVYQFAQNDNGAGTFGVTCTAKAAGKTVNFNAGPGSCGTSSLTETCDGSGVTLPAVTATGVCKGWTTFAGWATAAVSDSSTTSVTVYAAGSKFVPASNGQTLYAVYSKVKSGGGASWTLSTTAPSVGDSVMVAYYTGSVYKYMKNSGADNDDLTVSAGVATPVANGKFKLVSGNSYGVSLNSGSNYLHLNSSAINVTTSRTNGDINISSGSSANSFIIKRQTGASTYDRVLAWSGSNWTSSSSMGSGCEVYFFKRVTSTTYYCSDPNCCTELGSINGSFC